MAAIVIVPNPGANPAESGDGLVYSGDARCEGMSPTDNGITWTTDPVDPAAGAAAINAAIRDAAVAAALANDPSYEVGPLESKAILGGAVGLL